MLEKLSGFDDRANSKMNNGLFTILCQNFLDETIKEKKFILRKFARLTFSNCQIESCKFAKN
jgi:hypothetical protein